MCLNKVLSAYDVGVADRDILSISDAVRFLSLIPNAEVRKCHSYNNEQFISPLK